MNIECNIEIVINIDLNEAHGINNEIDTLDSILLEKGLELPYLKLLYEQIKEVIDDYDF